MKKLLLTFTAIYCMFYNLNAQNFEWANAIGSTSGDYGQSITVDDSGNTYVTGYFAGTVDFNPSAATANLTSNGGYDIFLAKYDINGNYIWAKAMGGTLDDQGFSVAVDDSSNSYLTGRFASTADFDPSAATANRTSAGIYDIFLAKYNSNGDYLWAKSMGGTSSEQGDGITIDAMGNSYITGNFQDTVDFDPSVATANQVSVGREDFFLAKYDATGNFIWANAIGSTGTDESYCVVVDDSGNTYITGQFTDTVDFNPSTATSNLTSAGIYDIFLAKYDLSGNYVWAKAISGTNSGKGYSVALGDSSNIYLTGTFYGTVDFDPSAATANRTSAGIYDMFLAKYSSNGNYVWAKAMGGTSSERGEGIALDAEGNLYVTGNFQNTVDFDPSTATANLTSTGISDMFLAKYTTNGNYIWAKSVGSTFMVRGNSVTVDKSGNAYLTGDLLGTADFDPSAATVNLTSAGDYDIFVSKYSSNGTVSISNKEKEQIVPKVYPNPTQTQLNIELKEAANLQLINLLGETLATQKAKKGNNTIDVSNLAPGVYFLKVGNQGAVKFIRK